MPAFCIPHFCLAQSSMIAKKHRVNRSKIDYIMKKGYSSSSSLFLVKFKKNSEQFSRYSVIISKKIAKEAVTRNLLRRRAYESLRLNIPNEENSATNHYDLIMIAKKHLASSTFKAIKSDVTNIQLTLLKNGKD